MEEIFHAESEVEEQFWKIFQMEELCKILSTKEPFSKEQ